MIDCNPKKKTKFYCNGPDDVPKTPHWAIIYQGNVVCGDDGYGSPSSTQFVRYEAYTDKQEWEANVRERSTPGYGRTESFLAMYVIPAKITTTVSVHIDAEQQADDSFTPR